MSIAEVWVNHAEASSKINLALWLVTPTYSTYFIFLIVLYMEGGVCISIDIWNSPGLKKKMFLIDILKKNVRMIICPDEYTLLCLMAAKLPVWVHSLTALYATRWEVSLGTDSPAGKEDDIYDRKVLSCQNKCLVHPYFCSPLFSVSIQHTYWLLLIQFLVWTAFILKPLGSEK